jgi:triacylglycerol lipase
LLAYAPADFAVRQFRGAGWTLDADQPFVGASTLCHVAYSPEAVIVAFRGTEVIKPGTAPTFAAFREVLADLGTDGRVALVESESGGAVHRGFHAALDQVWTTMLLPCLARLGAENPERSVWFTGHSLGAALATLAADRCRTVRGVYTFGSPLVGDRSFAQGFPVNAFRFVHNNDIVPHLPRFGPSATPPLIRAYQHVGQLQYIAADGTVKDNPSLWSRITDGFEGRYRHLLDATGQLRPGGIAELPDDAFNDHAPLFYALRVWNAYADLG